MISIKESTKFRLIGRNPQSGLESLATNSLLFIDLIKSEYLREVQVMKRSYLEDKAVQELDNLVHDNFKFFYNNWLELREDVRSMKSGKYNFSGQNNINSTVSRIKQLLEVWLFHKKVLATNKSHLRQHSQIGRLIIKFENDIEVHFEKSLKPSLKLIDCDAAQAMLKTSINFYRP